MKLFFERISDCFLPKNSYYNLLPDLVFDSIEKKLALLRKNCKYTNAFVNNSNQHNLLASSNMI